MITRLIFLCLFLALLAPARAQQPDPAMLQRAIVALQGQRNQAMDTSAAQQARADGLQDDLAKAQARIKELEPKQPDAAAPASK